ncbi:P-loop containing nucleoside triphosphate hydrolase protein [Xylariomycetidae sp. FL0641]|nr:P-loop containing nucleoside triphosphate hydrolase protein [Xylariomycetidae sp. FL0641]
MAMIDSFQYRMAAPYKLLARYSVPIQRRLLQLGESVKGLDAHRTPYLLDEDAAKDPLGQDQVHASLEDLQTRLSHLQTLNEFIQYELAYYHELHTTIETGAMEVIIFEDLWYLFRPGDTLYSEEDGQGQLYKVHALTGGQLRRRNRTEDFVLHKRRAGRRGHSGSDDEDENETREIPVQASGIGTWSPFVIDCFIMDFDGEKVGPTARRRMINYYSGTRKVQDLPIFPLRFHPKLHRVTSEYEARGRALLKSRGHHNYCGRTTAIIDPRQRVLSPKTTGDRQHDEFNGDVYIDPVDFYARFPLQKPRLGSLTKIRSDDTEVEENIKGGRQLLLDPEVDEKTTELFISSHQSLMDPVDYRCVLDSPDHLQLLNHRIPAYLLRERTYVQIHIENISEIEVAQNDGFKDLVIPEGHRTLLTALVENHAKGDHQGQEQDRTDGIGPTFDLVKYKGRGLIILLHGPPGSGKTSTAETVAAYTRRPLYSITCGDLGLEPDQIEISLRQHCDRAYRWGCVLLLDEADVFLTRRDWRDVSRNALVSIFLRQLEYYPGILFLTTNRVGVLDEAFKSRIHVSLQYPRLKLEDTRRIWNNTLNRIEKENATSKLRIRFDRSALLNFAEKHYKKHELAEATWNGRQIRNAFQTAVALGHYDRKKALRAANLTAEAAEASGERKWMSVRLKTENFRYIAKTAREFEDYLTSVRGPDVEVARENQYRDDTLDPDAPPATDTHEKFHAYRQRTHRREDSSCHLPVAPPPAAHTPRRSPVAGPEEDNESMEEFGDEDVEEDLSD